MTHIAVPAARITQVMAAPDRSSARLRGASDEPLPYSNVFSCDSERKVLNAR